MALLWASCFDNYGSNVALLTQGPFALASQVSLSAVNPRTGSRCARITGAFDNGLRRIFGGDKEVAGVGYAFFLPTLPSNNSSVCLASMRDDANTSLVSLIVGSTGQLILKRGLGTDATILGTSAPCVLAGSYQHFECRSEITGGTCSFEVRINGVTQLNVVGATVSAGEAAQVQIGTSGQGVFGFPAYMDVDDLYAWDDEGVSDNDFIGDKKVYLRFPSSDVLSGGWIPSVGSTAYPMLDNNPPLDGSEYLSAPGGVSSNELNTFGVDNFPAEVVSIAGVVIETRLWKTDAGNAKVQVGVQSGMSADVGAEHALSNAPTFYVDVFSTDPATGSVWSLAAVNAMLTSLERTE